MQLDGNLVVYKNPGVPIWGSDTYVGISLGGNRYLVPQSDCNMVMYQSYNDKTSKWNTKTYNPNAYCLTKLVM